MGGSTAPERRQIPLLDYDAGVWHGFVPGVGAGQAYGHRAAGPYDPGSGMRFNAAKLLLDPYARAIDGVTTVELLPVHESVPESFLLDRGLTNYWGYTTIGYFAPHQGYSAEVRAGRPGGKAWAESRGKAGRGEPRIGAHGTPIFFVHPRDMQGVLTELMEAPKRDH